MKRNTVRQMALCGAIAALGMSVPALAAAHSYNLAGQDLAQALRQFALQSGKQVLFKEGDVRGHSARAVYGSYEDDDALTTLLRGTGLYARKTRAGLYLIQVFKAAGRQGAASSAVALQSAPAEAPVAGTGEDAPGEIVVTAQGRTQRLQEVPISVSVTTGDTLKRDNVINLESLSVRSPNFRIATASQSDFITIRGVGSSLNLGFEQSVGTFVDGIYRGRARTTRSTLFDLERVELLKGPQTIFFGNNTIAGAVNITTRKPGREVEANASGSYFPNTGEYAVEGGFSVPISDTLALRIAARQSGQDGYIHNYHLDNKGPHLNDTVGRASLVWTPSSSVKTEASFEIGRNRDTGVGDYELVNCPPVEAAFGGAQGACARYLAATGGNIDDTLNYQSGANPSYFNYDYHQAAQTTTISLGRDDLVLTTGYFHHHFRLLYDPLPIPADQGGSVVGTDYAISAPIEEKYRQFSQEIRLRSPASLPVSYIVGAYYQWSDLVVDSYIGTFFAPIGNFSGGAYPGTTPFASRSFVTEKAHNFSAFGSVSARLSERLRLNLGLRYSRVSKDDDRLAQVGTVTGSVPSAPGAFTPVTAALQTTLAPRVGLAPGNFATPSRTDSKLLPSASLQYDVAHGVMVYASYAKGFKAGGYAIGAANASFGPETVDAYEIGLKSTFLDNRVTFNITGFYSDYKNLQESATIFPQGATATTQVVGNVAATTAKGIETGLTIDLSPNVRLFGDVAYLSSKYKDFPNGGCTSLQAATIPNCQQNLSGKDRAFSPKFSGNFGTNLNFPLSDSLNFKFDTTVYFASRFLQQPTSDPRLAQPAYAKVDARIALASSNGRWEAAVIGKNLTNKLTASYRQIFPSSPGSIAEYADPPRSIGFQLNLKY